METVDRYTYRVVYSDEDEEFVGLVAEFPSLSWLAASDEGALRGVKNLVREVIADMTKAKEELPEPISARKFSGHLNVRIPPDLHRRLSVEAAESNISLNRLVSMKLANV